MDSQNPVCVYVVQEPQVAELLKSALETEGIPCDIEGENQGGFAGILKIRLFVQAENVDRARDFLKAHEGEKYTDFDADSEEV